MSAQNQESLDNIQVDKNNLYREEVYTDNKMGTLRKMIPIKIDGSDDDSRKAYFAAQTNIMSPMGVLPINAQLEASDLEGAIAEFPAAMKVAVEKLVEEAREYQRQEASRIVVPDGQQGGRIQI